MDIFAREFITTESDSRFYLSGRILPPKTSRAMWTGLKLILLTGPTSLPPLNKGLININHPLYCCQHLITVNFTDMNKHCMHHAFHFIMKHTCAKIYLHLKLDRTNYFQITLISLYRRHCYYYRHCRQTAACLFKDGFV